LKPQSAFFVFWALIGGSASLAGAADTTGVHALGNLSLEELMDELVTVTSVSKRLQMLNDTATAVTVFSHSEIRRSGVTTVADALRLVPGMNVGSVNSSQWSVSSRGFAGLYANKLLVLVDGRAVYTPLFSGVFWDTEQLLLEDVDRIEIIRGPGATVWGANAVNGVVNVVTRSARDTQGALLYGSAGDVEEVGTGVRYGGRLAEHTYYRVIMSQQSRDDFRLGNGEPAQDGWRSQHGALRLDHHPDDDTQMTWLGGLTQVRTDDHRLDAYNVNTLGRVQRKFENETSFEVQAYYDRAARDDDLRANFAIDTFDLTAQHTFSLTERNEVIWGAGYRHVGVEAAQTTPAIEVRARNFYTQTVNVFAQNEFEAIPDKLDLTAGVKVEHNDYTGVEIQPSLRAAFKPTDRQTLWAAVSRAVRTPSIVEGMDSAALATGGPFVGPGGLPYVPRRVGNTDLASEVLWAYELGYRIQPTRRVSVDAAVFYNDYSDLISFAQTPRFVPPAPGSPVGTAEYPYENMLSGHSYGGELAVTVSPSVSWRLTASYSLLIADIRGPAGAGPEAIERSAPRNQVMLRSSHDLTAKLGLDVQFRYADALPTVPAYITADVRIAYQVTDRLEAALVGQNLLQDQHLEQGTTLFLPTTEVLRGFYGKLTWRF
jgi:iron complex outermembrane receptor protein